jgi:hypothetical protein
MSRSLNNGQVQFCDKSSPNWSGTDMQPGIHSLRGCIATSKKNDMNTYGEHNSYNSNNEGGSPRLCFSCNFKNGSKKCGDLVRQGREEKNMLVSITQSRNESCCGHQKCRYHYYFMDLVWTDDL